MADSGREDAKHTRRPEIPHDDSDHRMRRAPHGNKNALAEADGGHDIR